MRLYTQTVAPNPTKVELYLAEKAGLGCTIPLERVMVNLGKGEHRSGELALKNPLQRLPFLEVDDGAVITESLAIIEYCEERWPSPALIGTTPEARAQVRALERGLDQDIMVGIITMVHATRSPLGYPPDPAVAAWARSRMQAPLKTLESRLADGRNFVAGEALTIADCTLAAALQFARFSKLDLLSDSPHIAAWDAGYRRRDAARAVLIL
jgi:glutathione S-transferase